MGWSRAKPPRVWPGEGKQSATAPAGLTVPVPARSTASALAALRPVAARVELLDTVLETIGVGIAACDADGHLTLFNDAARRFHGIPADPSVDAEEWSERFDLFEADGITRLLPQEVPLYRALVDGSVSGRMITIVPPGSPPRLVHCDGQQLRDSQGAVTGAMVAMTDVTAADLAATVIAEGRAQTARLIQHSLDAYIATDERGRVVAWNPGAEDLYAMTAADAVGRELHTIVTPAEDGSDHGERLRAFLREGSTEHVVRHRSLPVVRHDGVRLLVDSTAWTCSTDFGWGLHTFVRRAVPTDAQPDA